MKKFLVIILVTLIVSVAYVLVNGASVGFAQCVPVYGYGQQCPPGVNIAVNKVVANPQTGAFVDNLGINDPKFIGDQIITFQIVVTNTGNSNIAQVIVREVFPQFTNFVAGPGTFDSNSKTVTFEITSLLVGESRTFTVQGRVVPETQLPADQGVICVTNQVTATTNDGKSSSDNAQFCIERRVLGGVSKGAVIFPPAPVTQIPVTGGNLMQLLALIPTALVGFALRKRAQG